MALVIFALLLTTLFFTAGCAKKAVVPDDKGAVKEQAAAGQSIEPVKPPAVEEAKPSKPAGEELALNEGPGKAGWLGTEEKPYMGSYEFTGIGFDFDKFNLSEEAREILKKHAAYLNKHKDIMVIVEGHCDERGTTEYNLALGERRASAVAKFLTDMGVDAKRIKTVSYGEEMPFAPAHNEDAWAKNRRAHFKATGAK